MSKRHCVMRESTKVEFERPLAKRITNYIQNTRNLTSEEEITCIMTIRGLSGTLSMVQSEMERRVQVIEAQMYEDTEIGPREYLRLKREWKLAMELEHRISKLQKFAKAHNV